MRVPRIYQNTDLYKGQSFFLSADAAHHLANVLRMKTGQAVVIFNGQGGYFDAKLQQFTKRQVEVVIGEFHSDEKESQLQITLAQGISRGQRMDYTIQKAVELGVSEIVPVICQHGNVRLDRQQQKKRMEHWQKIIIGACEQTGRNCLPILGMPVNFDDWITKENNALKLLLHPNDKQILGHYQPEQNHVILLAGPEGGFCETEIEYAVRYGFKPVTLGPRILRSETTALAAITACQVLWGDMNKL